MYKQDAQEKDNRKNKMATRGDFVIFKEVDHAIIKQT